MLHWDRFLLKQLYNLDLKIKENWPKNERTIKISFLGLVIIQKNINTLVY